jgi:uncharacterized protein
MLLSRYLKIYPCPDQPGRNLLYSTTRSATVLVDDSTLLAARQGTLAEEKRNTLARLGFLVSDPAAEREQLRQIFVTANQSTHPFNAVVVLNLDCNLACAYCYEDRFRGCYYMSPEIAALLVETVQCNQIEQGRDVTLSFYGGEPLLSSGLIKDVSIPLQQAAARQGSKYRFSLVTNGTLLSRSLVEELLPLGLCGAKITLDGPRELHDQSRPYISGRGSFDTILSNVAAVCDLLPLQLGGNFTRQNYRQFPALLDHLLDAGVTPDRVASVLFSPVAPKSGERLLGDFDSVCSCSYEPWLIEATLFLREEILQRGYPAPKPRISPCMVELESDLIVNYDGSLYKCPAFMAYDSLRVGTLAEGVGDYRVSHNLGVWKNDRCLDCAYLPLCFGGCRQLTLLRNGAIDDVDCRKEYYDATLERIIRQDLQYQPTRKN